MLTHDKIRRTKDTQYQREKERKIKNIIQQYMNIKGEPEIANKSYVRPEFFKLIVTLATLIIEPNNPSERLITSERFLKDSHQLISFAKELVAEMNKNNPYNIISYTIKTRSEPGDSRSLYLIIHNKQDRAIIRNRKKQEDDAASDADTDDESLTTPALLSTVRQLHSRLLALELE